MMIDEVILKLCYRGIIWLVAGDKKKAYPLFEEARKKQEEIEKSKHLYISIADLLNEKGVSYVNYRHY